RVDRRGQWLATDTRDQVCGGHRGHLAPGRARGRGDVRDDEAVVEGEEWVAGGQRLGIGDVERGAGDRAIAERVDERHRVDDRATRGVHEDGARAHPAQALRVEQALGPRAALYV